MCAGNGDHAQFFVTNNLVDQFVAFAAFYVLTFGIHQLWVFWIFFYNSRRIHKPVDGRGFVYASHSLYSLANMNVGHAMFFQILNILRILFVAARNFVAGLTRDHG